MWKVFDQLCFFRVFGRPKSNQLLLNHFKIMFFSDNQEAKVLAAKNNALSIPTQGFLMRNKLVIWLVILADSLLLTHSGHLWRLTNHNPILVELQEHLSNRYSPLDQGIPSQQPREHVLYIYERLLRKLELATWPISLKFSPWICSWLTNLIAG